MKRFVKFTKTRGKNNWNGHIVYYPKTGGYVEDKSSVGIYFANIDNAFQFMGYGKYMWYVEPTSDVMVHKGPHNGEGPELEYWCRRAILSKPEKITFSVIKRLISEGARIDTPKDGGSLLFHLIKQHYPVDNINEILSMGCKFNNLSLYPLFAFPWDDYEYDDEYIESIYNIVSKYTDLNRQIDITRYELEHLISVYQRCNCRKHQCVQNGLKYDTDYNPALVSYSLTHPGVYFDKNGILRDENGFQQLVRKRKDSKHVRKTK